MYDFGLRLKELRERQKLSQAQVARRLNIKRATVSCYENNISMPSVHILARLAQLYRVPSDYLLGLDNRTIIALDELTPRQSTVIKDITDSLIAEFKLTNLEKPVK